MSFRRDGKRWHKHWRDWDAWKEENADLIKAAGLPPFVTGSADDWKSFLLYGYACQEPYGKYVGNFVFDDSELTPDQRDALQHLIRNWESSAGGTKRP